MMLQQALEPRARAVRHSLASGLSGWHYGWIVVAVAFLTSAATMGTRAAFGVLLVTLVDAFGWGRGLTAGAIGLNALCAMAVATPAGLLLDRWGPRWVYGAAAVAAGAGLVLTAGTHEPW